MFDKFDRMKGNRWFVSVVIALLIFGCTKEEPFEFPEDPEDPQPQVIIEMQRVMKTSEQWEVNRSVEGCNPNVDERNLAISEVNDGSGQALIQLVPSEEGCALSLDMTSAINASEVSKRDWEELTYEFTYSEYGSTDGTHFFIVLYYKELELELNLVPYISSLLGNDNTDGLVKLWFENEKPAFSINGVSFNPNFDLEENHFSMQGNASENYVGFGLSSDGSPEQSFAVSQFLRITRFGLED